MQTIGVTYADYFIAVLEMYATCALMRACCTILVVLRRFYKFQMSCSQGFVKLR